MLDAKRIGQCENVVDEDVGFVLTDVLRPVGSREPALVRHHKEEVTFEPRRDFAPRAMRFREAVEQDDRGLGRIAGQRDVERHPGADRNAAKLGHG